VSLDPKFATVLEGASLAIQCNVTGKPVPIVLWSKPYGWLSHNHVVSGSELRILKATPDDGGTYVCSGQNKLGVQSQTSVISVERKLVFHYRICLNTAQWANSRKKLSVESAFLTIYGTVF